MGINSSPRRPVWTCGVFAFCIAWERRQAEASRQRQQGGGKRRPRRVSWQDRRGKGGFISCRVITVFKRRSGNVVGKLEKWQLKIRKYQPSDCRVLTELFYHTVHTVNAKDYTGEQLKAWATGQVDFDQWDQSLQEHYSLVAVDNGIIVGFGDIDETGYLDRLFVHADYQGKGVGTAICDQLEQAAEGTLTTHASITAKLFFEKRG